MPTYTPKPGEVERRWHVIDANDVVLGRLASQAATLLRGKHKPQFAPHIDTGDFVVIVNAAKVAVAGRQARRDCATATPATRAASSRHRRRAARAPARSGSSSSPSAGMLPKNTLGRAQLKKLKVYAGPDHPHAAQKPQPFEIKQVSQ